MRQASQACAMESDTGRYLVGVPLVELAAAGGEEGPEGCVALTGLWRAGVPQGSQVCLGRSYVLDKLFEGGAGLRSHAGGSL